MKLDLKARQLATQTTISNFKDKPYILGSGDCAKLVIDHLYNMGKPIISNKDIKKYKSILSAKTAIKKATGHNNLIDFMSANFETIAPAAAILGDVVAMEAEHPIGCLSIFVGNATVFAYEADNEYPVYGRIIKPITAWRV